VKLVPVMTEKSLALVKKGGFTFWMDRFVTKPEVKRIVEAAFGVHVVNVRTANYKGLVKRTVRGQMRKIKPAKRVIVYLKGEEKIDLFEDKKEKSSKGRSASGRKGKKK
jgi:ribosomal protein L23